MCGKGMLDMVDLYLGHAAACYEGAIGKPIGFKQRQVFLQCRAHQGFAGKILDAGIGRPAAQ